MIQQDFEYHFQLYSYTKIYHTIPNPNNLNYTTRKRHFRLFIQKINENYLIILIPWSSIWWQEAILMYFRCGQCLPRWYRVLKHWNWKFPLVSDQTYLLDSFVQCLTINCSRLGQLLVKVLNIICLLTSFEEKNKLLPHIMISNIFAVFYI